jgi:Ni/Fe-hydrogenase subunit HybB-like protein
LEDGSVSTSGDAQLMRSAMHKEWSAWYSALVAASALIALIEIAWFLLRNDDRLILLAAFIVAAAVFWATWAPGTGSCC